MHVSVQAYFVLCRNAHTYIITKQKVEAGILIVSKFWYILYGANVVMWLCVHMCVCVSVTTWIYMLCSYTYMYIISMQTAKYKTRAKYIYYMFNVIWSMYSFYGIQIHATHVAHQMLFYHVIKPCILFACCNSDSVSDKLKLHPLMGVALLQFVHTWPALLIASILLWIRSVFWRLKTSVLLWSMLHSCLFTVSKYFSIPTLLISYMSRLTVHVIYLFMLHKGGQWFILFCTVRKPSTWLMVAPIWHALCARV